MILTLILFYLLINFSNQYQVNIKEPKIVLFDTENNYFLLNGNHYRESINDRFILQLKPGEYNISNNKYQLFDGKLIYGKPYAKDSLLKPNITSQISSAYSYNIDNQYLHIFANVANLQKKILKFNINHNGKIIKEVTNNKLNFKTIVKAYPGLNVVSLNAISNDYFCICPTMNKGYTHSYQLAIWNDTFINENEVVTNKAKEKEDILDTIYIKFNESKIDYTLNHYSY